MAFSQLLELVNYGLVTRQIDRTYQLWVWAEPLIAPVVTAGSLGASSFQATWRVHYNQLLIRPPLGLDRWPAFLFADVLYLIDRLEVSQNFRYIDIIGSDGSVQ